MTSMFRAILDFVYQLVGNYGWAVIIFSLLIKCVLLPLDIKSRRSMRAMSALNPTMEELKKRYGDDQQKLNQKMSDLYKKNKVNPLSGCLPMLIQLPILWIMFKVMRYAAAELQMQEMFKWVSANLTDGNGTFLALDSTAVQNALETIRSGGALSAFNQESWLWIKNVFQPDTFSKTVIPTISEISTTLQQYKDMLTEKGWYDLLSQYAQDANGIASAVDAAVRESCGYKSFDLFMGLTKINFPTNWSTYVNGVCALPILAAVTQVLSTKLQPTQPDANSNSAATGKFMTWFFPLFSLWICWSSTAAFSIYWVFVNVWTIVTTFFINKLIDRKEAAGGQTTKEELNP